MGLLTSMGTFDLAFCHLLAALSLFRLVRHLAFPLNVIEAHLGRQDCPYVDSKWQNRRGAED
jgi:hypothetical protein